MYHTLSVWDKLSWFSMNSGLATFSKLPRNVLHNISKHRDVSWLSQYKSHGKGLVSEGANNWALGVECRRFPTPVMRSFLEQNKSQLHPRNLGICTYISHILPWKKQRNSCRLGIPFVPWMVWEWLNNLEVSPPVLRQAKNMGCVVRAFDVRPATREQVVAAGGADLPPGQAAGGEPREFP